jgi:phosphohistidine phosphatase SixA
VQFDRHRRALLYFLITLSTLGRSAAARQSGRSAAEHLIAAIQDGGKIVYLRPLPADGMDRARELGRALHALRVPLNEILAAPMLQARRSAELAFGTERLREAKELADTESATVSLQALRQLLRTIPGPGMNRILVGDRAPLELAAERRFPDTVMPAGGMAVFLAGDTLQLLGTITAERVIASAKARGAL